MLTGTVSVLHSNVNMQSDFSSLLVKSSEPVRTPSANGGFLGGLNFDVQIQTAADAQIETSLTQGIQAEASLRLRGTAGNPALHQPDGLHPNAEGVRIIVARMLPLVEHLIAEVPQ